MLRVNSSQALVNNLVTYIYKSWNCTSALALARYKIGKKWQKQYWVEKIHMSVFR